MLRLVTEKIEKENKINKEKKEKKRNLDFALRLLKVYGSDSTELIWIISVVSSTDYLRNQNNIEHVDDILIFFAFVLHYFS